MVIFDSTIFSTPCHAITNPSVKTNSRLVKQAPGKSGVGEQGMCVYKGPCESTQLVRRHDVTRARTRQQRSHCVNNSDIWTNEQQARTPTCYAARKFTLHNGGIELVKYDLSGRKIWQLSSISQMLLQK